MTDVRPVWTDDGYASSVVRLTGGGPLDGTTQERAGVEVGAHAFYAPNPDQVDLAGVSQYVILKPGRVVGNHVEWEAVLRPMPDLDPPKNAVFRDGPMHGHTFFARGRMPRGVGPDPYPRYLRTAEVEQDSDTGDPIVVFRFDPNAID